MCCGPGGVLLGIRDTHVKSVMLTSVLELPA